MSGAVLKILIVDDTPTNARQLEAVAKKLGHEAVLAQNGQEAVDRFLDSQPDLIFMDVMMPVMDGIEAARHIREHHSERWTPIVFFSALDQMQDIVRGLEAGGDDYIVKPASLQILRAKINSYARVIALQREVRANTEELRNWRADAEEQTRLGAHVMSRLTDAAGLRDPMVRHFNMPAETFSGDLLCAARAPGEVLHVLLADATGHGLAAALTAMPLTQAFYSMTAKGFPLPSIVEELNRKLKSILPSDRFVAATMAAIDVRNQTVEIWNGGNPDALFINQRGEIVMRWTSRHPPLGILPDKYFSGATETVAFKEEGDLLLCSDGLTEAETPEGEWFGIDGVIRSLTIQGDASSRYMNLLGAVESHLAGRPGRDDISALLVNIPLDRRRQLRLDAPVQAHQGHLTEWRLNLSYGAEELRYIDVAPAVLGFITQVKTLKPHQGALFLIISELFNNALDHGILGLDSSTKTMIGGFEIYMHQRGERLARLRNGRIDLSFLLHQEGSRAVLDISLQDSGKGFDFDSRINTPPSLTPSSDVIHGRGIALVRNLCEQVIYSGAGNKVWARYVISDLILTGGEDEHAPQDGASLTSPDGGLVLF